MIAAAFARHMRKHPIPDDEIISGLEWVEAMIHIVKFGDAELPAVPESSDALDNYLDGQDPIFSAALTEGIA